LAEYRTSVHGKLLAKGDDHVAICTDCHTLAAASKGAGRGGHGIRAVKDPVSPVNKLNVPVTCSRCHSDPDYMKGYGIPTDQFEKYKESVHGVRLFKDQDTSVPVCNTCHGNHGAVPPGLTGVAHVCGQCHATQEEDFEHSSHAKVFAERNKPACVSCHSNHLVLKPSDEMLQNNNPRSAACIACHQRDDLCWMQTDQMLISLTQLKGRIKDADEKLKQAETMGMDVMKARYELTGAQEKLTLARVRLHRFNAREVRTVTEAGDAIADRSREAGAAALGEHTYRRKGLAASVVVIAVDIVLLVWMIRRRRRRAAEAKG
jgi:hypothetical protein